jgi:predicted signal transduction protein with EAL and GGDEF domain
LRHAEARLAGSTPAASAYITRHRDPSIGHLRRLDFDIIVIDRSLVADVHRRTRRVVSHISRTLRSQPLAEGVEDADQVAALRAAGASWARLSVVRPMDRCCCATRSARNLGASAG